ncbi:Protoheme IX farnesyltransferase [Candidatus Filomicrobium marinum]|uniref:Protoheme IX farnesyltransferase n=1 Tax=Candidatus Filomicrobium marinum TaxID=1608628 RepID=A0A0D6JKE7_9HYPH|nr:MULTISPECIES: heme o synthase [Filomicrobium]MCV0369155.1 heme o synthase [Filomicrobium sp.]CFX60349.1 Protoheme IX farnesyltransferase [Candidatus Filomicrobium marinum]CPR22411.1 Protoheme IX farnesyltransferase [Candidatus Filomicrobium marinum]
MSVTSRLQADVETVAVTGTPSVGDFVALMKPRVMSLVVFTGLTGMVAAPGHLHPVLAIIAILAIAVGAGASGALNMWYDADIDRHMARTAARPIPRGLVSAGEALGFGIVLSVASIMTLGVLVNWTAGGLLALTIGFYIFVYTMWLKRRTPQNIVIGGAAGAFPPMIGWAAVTGGISIESVLLFLIIFMWTPPHFWALALYRCRDYERVGVPMLPVVAGPKETRRQIVIYSLLLVPLAVAPSFIGLGGAAYGATSVVLGIVFLWFAFKVARVTEGREADHAAKQLFGFSIFYLFALFAVLLTEHVIATVTGAQVTGLGLF